MAAPDVMRYEGLKGLLGHIAGPWDEPLHIGARSALVGGAILFLSFFRGPERERIGGGWRRVWTTPLHVSDVLREGQQWKKVG
jgi:hypothetical protein